MSEENQDDVPLLTDLDDKTDSLNSEDNAESPGRSSLFGNDIPERELATMPPAQDNDQPREQLVEHEEDQHVTSCYEKCCVHKSRTSTDGHLLILHIINFFVNGAIAATIFFDKKKSHGLCLLHTKFELGGVVEYSTKLYWCNLLLYCNIISISVSFISIVVKWTAQVFGVIKWLRTELILNVLNLLFVVVVLVAQSYRLATWCTEMHTAIHPDYFDKAFDKTLHSPSRCEKDAQQIDKNIPQIVKMHSTYVFTVIEMTISSIHLLLWVVIVYFAWKRLSYAQQQKKDRELLIQREVLKHSMDMPVPRVPFVPDQNAFGADNTPQEQQIRELEARHAMERAEEAGSEMSEQEKQSNEARRKEERSAMGLMNVEGAAENHGMIPKENYWVFQSQAVDDNLPFNWEEQQNRSPTY